MSAAHGEAISFLCYDAGSTSGKQICLVGCKSYNELASFNCFKLVTVSQRHNTPTQLAMPSTSFTLSPQNIGVETSETSTLINIVEDLEQKPSDVGVPARSAAEPSALPLPDGHGGPYCR